MKTTHRRGAKLNPDHYQFFHFFVLFGFFKRLNSHGGGGSKTQEAEYSAVQHKDRKKSQNTDFPFGNQFTFLISALLMPLVLLLIEPPVAVRWWWWWWDPDISIESSSMIGIILQPEFIEILLIQVRSFTVHNHLICTLSSLLPPRDQITWFNS